AFKIDGDTMTISGGDLERPTAFVRKGGGAMKRGLGAKIKNLGASDGAKTDVAALPAAGDESKAAVGRWEFKTDKATIGMSLDPDGTGTFNGKPMKWSLKGGVLTTTVGENSLQYKTAVSGDTLKLTMPGGTNNTIAFERVKGGGGAGQPGPFDVVGKVAGAATDTPAAGGLE